MLEIRNIVELYNLNNNLQYICMQCMSNDITETIKFSNGIIALSQFCYKTAFIIQT